MEGVPPPLQTDLPGHGVRGGIPHPRHGEAEGVEGGGGGEERGEVAVGVALAHQRLAMALREGQSGLAGRRLIPRCLRHQATAIRAAATLRFSATRML